MSKYCTNDISQMRSGAVKLNDHISFELNSRNFDLTQKKTEKNHIFEMTVDGIYAGRNLTFLVCGRQIICALERHDFCISCLEFSSAKSVLVSEHLS